MFACYKHRNVIRHVSRSLQTLGLAQHFAIRNLIFMNRFFSHLKLEVKSLLTLSCGRKVANVAGVQRQREREGENQARNGRGACRKATNETSN